MKKLFAFLIVASAAVACNDSGTEAESGTGTDTSATTTTPPALTDTLPPVVVDTTVKADSANRQ